MTAVFIGLILAELNMLQGWLLFWYVIWCVWRILKMFD